MRDSDSSPPPPTPGWGDHLARALERRRAVDGFRSRRVVNPIDATHVEIDGRRLVNFASNNYLGLSHHPDVIDAFKSAAIEFGVGSGAAALVSGYGPEHAQAEAVIARWKGTESAVLTSSGYAANLAAVQTIAAVAEQSGSRVRFLVDKLAHASLIDAVRAADQPFRVFPHNGMTKLERLLADADAGEVQVLVTESIFSMDGDAADLAALAEIKARRPFLLLLDEAHGSGVYGKHGSGYAAEVGLNEIVDVTVVTLSKAVGVSGGAVCASHAFCEAVVNFGRSFIYSTNIPPAVAAAAAAAVKVMENEPARQARVRALARAVRQRLTAAGLTITPGDSPIIPLIVGDETTALDAARRLKEAGLLVVAIRPPTVPKGQSRLRVTLTSEHTDDEVDRFVGALISSKLSK